MPFASHLMEIDDQDSGMNPLTAFFLLMVSVLITGCREDLPLQYQYADGSNHTFYITPDSLRFVPLPSGLSSSGYDHGLREKVRTLSSAEFQEIQALMRKAVDRIDIHIGQRVMMSGSIKVITPSQSRVYILSPECAEKRAIETWLHAALGLEPDS